MGRRSSKSSKRSRRTGAWIIGPSRGSVVLGALALWSPSATDLVNGTLGPVTAVVRFGLAVAVAWLALDLLRRVVQFYSRANSSEGQGDDDLPAAAPPLVSESVPARDRRPASRLAPLMHRDTAEAEPPGAPTASRLEIRRRGVTT